MKSLVVLSALFLWAAAYASAQEATPVVVAPTPSDSQPAPSKVGTVFGQNAIGSTQEGRKASAALSQRLEPKRQEYLRKQTELQNLRDTLKKGMATMSPETKGRYDQAIDTKAKELQRLTEDTQNQMDEEEGAMVQELGDKLLQVIQQYAARNGYALILDVSLPNGPVMWASPSIDLTNEIVKLYDQTYPVVSTPSPLSLPSVKK